MSCGCADGMGGPCNFTGDATGQGVCGELGLRAEGFALQHSLGDAALYVWALGGTFPELSRKLPVGDAALYVWALGLFAAGQSSTMVCTYAGQVIMGGMVQIKLRPWKQIAMTRALALGPALAVAVSTYGDQRLFNRINEYLNVLQSVLPSPDAAAVLRRCDRRPIDT